MNRFEKIIRPMKIQTLKLTVLAALFLLIAALSASADARPDPAAALAAALAHDARLGATRNEASKTKSIARAIEEYVQGLDALDLQDCPEGFAAALRNHRDAWQDSIEFFEQFGDLRGELHEIFDEIYEMGGSVRVEFEKVRSEITSTWEEVEKAASVEY